ncbi:MULTISPECIES: DUF302 domain-containing protein [Williamsia]|uniref:Uncharacterized protein DUF302 n=1 Tax=Williamsia marianensis TaxID=85044 RepID=A0A315S2W5_WILMA|nr:MULTISPECIES: DUF302 domain-containing protein [Williamsia]ETD32225.1 ABC transporter [Williamsia sp. D3]PVY26923.1 uncharacterized protein DUF302 [Williamsia marianensis]PZT96759.1 MAG: DUF302 domain-containing protein [Gordonia sp. (in: high G+C Gram-positive bacteria)]RKR79764.1 uncharacterized protein DUF302 [Williamsia muralis]
MSLAISTVLHLPFDEAVARTRAALADQGFGILTEINVKDTLKTKIDVDMENYLILGACNPPLAHRALEINRQIGLLLPCNVVVRTDPTNSSNSIVEAMNPALMVEVSGEAELEPVAADASAKLSAAIAALEAVASA